METFHSLRAKPRLEQSKLTAFETARRSMLVNNALAIEHGKENQGPAVPDTIPLDMW